jgi:predicted phosphodiesterase
MKRLLLAAAVVAILSVAVAWSFRPPVSGDLRVEIAEKNPWNHLRINSAPDEFQFVVVSDRTGGHRANIFSKAVEQINLLQPEFVLSVGDLIEGYTTNREKLATEWAEFTGFINKLQMPFFYVAGNHDLTNSFQVGVWREQFGRTYYHFVYKNVLFLCANTEDFPEGGKGAFISAEQTEYFRKVLAENTGVRWTIVAVHKPLWTANDADKIGWTAFEKVLVESNRPYTVFAGHVHRYQKFVRFGRNYYQFATTGGGSKLRGTRYGEFDHLVWVTMKKDGPVLANIMMDGILPENLAMPRDFGEAGKPIADKRACHPTQGKVLLDGKPVGDARVQFHFIDEARRRLVAAGDALTEENGDFILSTYTANDGSPAGKFVVTVVRRVPSAEDPTKLGENTLPAKYADTTKSPLRFEVKEGPNEFVIELKSD